MSCVSLLIADFDVGKEVIRWAKDRCPSYITNDGIVTRQGLKYSFYFSEEADATLFSLKWSTLC